MILNHSNVLVYLMMLKIFCLKILQPEIKLCLQFKLPKLWVQLRQIVLLKSCKKPMKTLKILFNVWVKRLHLKNRKKPMQSYQLLPLILINKLMLTLEWMKKWVVLLFKGQVTKLLLQVVILKHRKHQESEIFNFHSKTIKLEIQKDQQLPYIFMNMVFHLSKYCFILDNLKKLSEHKVE